MRLFESLTILILITQSATNALVSQNHSNKELDDRANKINDSKNSDITNIEQRIISNKNSGLKHALKNSVIINDNNNIANVVSSNIIVNNNGATDIYSIQPILLQHDNGNMTFIGKNIVKNNRIMSTFINPNFNFLFSDESKDFDVKTKSIPNS